MVIALGTPPERVLALLGWTVRNVWLRDTERRDIERRHPIFGNLVAVTAAILGAPSAVHEDRRHPDVTYFIVDGHVLRDLGAEVPRSARFVDLTVQSHQVSGVTLHRVFHVAPTRQNKGGRQVWP